jgi:hypothetical protein
MRMLSSTPPGRPGPRALTRGRRVQGRPRQRPEHPPPNPGIFDLILTDDLKALFGRDLHTMPRLEFAAPKAPGQTTFHRGPDSSHRSLSAQTERSSKERGTDGALNRLELLTADFTPFADVDLGVDGGAGGRYDAILRALHQRASPTTRCSPVLIDRECAGAADKIRST